MQFSLVFATSIGMILTIADELVPLSILPLGGSSMAQLGILFFGTSALVALVQLLSERKDNDQEP